MATLVDQVAAVLAFARAQIGQMYVWGGESRAEGGFDCSGLAQAAYNAAGVALPRTAQAQFTATRQVAVPQSGDLVFFGSSSTSIHHVGIYVGNGMMIDAPDFGERVGIHKISSYGDYFAATRPLAGGAAGDAALDPSAFAPAAAAGDAARTAAASLIGTVSRPLTRLTIEGLALLAGVGLVVAGAAVTGPGRAARAFAGRGIRTAIGGLL